MAYEITSWTRCFDLHGILNGEEPLRLIRVRHFGNAQRAMAALMQDFSVCRVTLSRPGTEQVWDLFRSNARDTALDSSMRSVTETVGSEQRVDLDIGPGITQKQLENAVHELVTQPGKLY